MAAEPTPRPTMKRARDICGTLNEDDQIMEPVKNNAHPMYMPSFRPNLSVSSPAIKAPTRAPPEVSEVISSDSEVVSL